MQENTNQFSITNQFQESAKMINDNLPRKKEVATPNTTQPKIVEDPLVAKLKKWLLIVLSTLVAGGAIILIIIRMLRKFLG